MAEVDPLQPSHDDETTAVDLLAPVRSRAAAIADRWPLVKLAADVQGRFSEVHGGYLAAAITLAGFLSLFPLLLVTIAVLGFVAGGGAGEELVDRVIRELSLAPRGETADAVRNAVVKAEESKRVASAVGLVGLLWSGLGLVAALEHAFDSTWQVTGRGLKGKLFGLIWLAGATALFLGSFAITGVLAVLPGILAPLNLAVGVAVNLGLFLWTAKVLANRDVGWRPLVPGAVAFAVGLELLKVAGGIYVPRLVSTSSALYGTIGVVFAVLAWLFFFGRLVVYAAVVNVVLWERGHGTTTVRLEVPAVPGEAPTTGTRSGEAEPTPVAAP